MQQISCKQCGTCCTKGGPALHKEDLELIVEGKLPLDKLITLRKGEPAHNPIHDAIKPTSTELIKIVGSGKDWACTFLDKDKKSCSVYSYRPKSCQVLECWDTTESINLIEKDTLGRLDIVNDPVYRQLIIEHEQGCEIPDMTILLEKRPLPAGFREEMEALVNRDLVFRTQLLQDRSLTLQLELFYFGRPVFQLLQPFGVKVSQSGKAVNLTWPQP